MGGELTPGRGSETDRASPREIRGQARPVSRWTSSLEQHGGFVLLLAGSGLIALAAVLADKPAVAPLFAVFGAVCIILGCFYSRIEGNVEATREGLRMVVREVELRGLPPEEVPDVLDHALENYRPSSSRPGEMLRAAEVAASEAVSAARNRHQTLAAAFAAWLRDQGWTVREPPLPVGADLIARRDNETLVVEVKASASPSNLATATVQLWDRMLAATERWPGVHGALVVPLESAPWWTAAWSRPRPNHPFVADIYGVDSEGQVKRLTAWNPPTGRPHDEANAY